MHIYILGICGTFMGGTALLARDLGHTIRGSDANAYPPMSTLLIDQGINVHQGYDAAHLEPRPELVMIGNVLSRGNPEVEAVLDQGLRYISGAQWLAENVLHRRWVLAVAGTHGKTTTSAMLAWILEYAGLNPGFLIGGVPQNFGVSARLGEAPFFVIEADEYDTAFFDKRSKFVHYRPRTLVLNNLEYDHADIFSDLAAIQTQFHHLVRTVPASGRLFVNGRDANLAAVLEQGCWTPVEHFGDAHDWRAEALTADGGRFRVIAEDIEQGVVEWELIGEHNMMNALAAIAAARHAGVPTMKAIEALAAFAGVKRRLEVCARVNGITVYDDFAHHPTEIAKTLQAVRARVGDERLIAVLEPRSNTMRMGVHREALAEALAEADEIHLLWPPDMQWDPAVLAAKSQGKLRVAKSVETIVETLAGELRSRDHVVIMSNGGFGGIHSQLADRLRL